mmetsp:Transcript_15020/g.38991  ORF Transcript_15020/g.38991 Transcript_15020/m.38991 type:complete len:219 (-) Transcript_15020:110-766(-)
MCAPIMSDGSAPAIVIAHKWCGGLLATGIIVLIANVIAGAAELPLATIGAIGGIFAIAASSTVLCCSQNGSPERRLSRFICARYMTFIAMATFAGLSVGLFALWLVFSTQCDGSNACLASVSILWVAIAFNLVAITISAATLRVLSRACLHMVQIRGGGGEVDGGPVVEAQVIVVGSATEDNHDGDGGMRAGQELPSATAVPVGVTSSSDQAAPPQTS